jgi:SnoaL-like protein
MAVELNAAERVASAMEARDYAALAEVIASDARLRSPITAAFEFRGRDEIVELLRVVRDAYDEIEYTDVFQTGDVGGQVFRARVGGQTMEGIDFMRLGADGRVREFTVFFRPLPGLAALTEALATRIARRQSGTLALVIRALIRPLVLMTRIGDRLAPTLLRRGFRRSSAG